MTRVQAPLPDAGRGRGRGHTFTTMNLSELRAQVALGEDSRRQFKQDVTNADALAAEMAAFANSEGGAIVG